MRSFLVLSFYLMILAFVSGRIFSEIASPRPRATITQNQLQKIRILRPQTREELIGKIIYIKQILELNCMKKIFNDISNKNVQPSRIRMLPFKSSQNRILNVKYMRPNFVYAEPQNRINFGKNKIIFLPNREQFIEKKTNKFRQNKISHSSASKVISNRKLENFNKKKQNTSFFENLQRIIDKHEIKEKFLKEKQKPNNIKLIPPIYPIKTFHSQQCIEVVGLCKDIGPIREELKTYLFGKKKSKDFKNRTSDERTYLKSFLSEGNEKKSNTVKPQSLDLNNSSINTVLRSSTESTISSTKNVFLSNGYLESALNKINLHTDNGTSNFNKKTTKTKNPVNLQEQSKQLKTAPSYYYKMNKNSEERSTKGTTEFEIEANFTTTVKVENVKSTFTKTVTKAPSNVLETKKYSDSVKTPEQTTAVTKVQNASEFFENITNLDVKNISIEDQKLSITTSLPLTVAESTNKNFTKLDEAQLLKSQTTPSDKTKGFANAKFSNADSWDKITKTPDVRKMKTGVNFSVEKMPIFTEFTDLPLSIDLLTTRKKEQDTAFKNSRKIHFNEEILTTTMSDEDSNTKDFQQRRSDILIDENLDDYLLYDGGITSNYLKNLKEKHFRNSTSHSIFELIPFVIHDLREKKIAPEDIQILSKAFDNHWTTVLALSNNTNIDMLPLLKMKNEEDLNNILSTFFPENSSKISTELPKTANNNYLEYYYESGYEDLREDQKDLREKEEAFRFKRDVKDSRYFDGLKEEQTSVNNYKYKSGLMSEVPDLNKCRLCDIKNK